MIQLSQPTETRLLQATRDAGQNPDSFLSALLDEYLEDKIDVALAEKALQEPGEMSLQDFRAKNGI